MTEIESTRIAIRGNKVWTIDDWKKIDFSLERGWQEAIDIFEDRIRGRFLDLIDRIEGINGAGFAVMALDCLLIETLQQFREGKADTPYRMSGEYFRRFLTRTSFTSDFDVKKADLFYDQIRCGILHQAEVKTSSKIQTRDEIPLVSADRSGGLIINRRKFHKKLERVFQEYLDALRKSDPIDEPLRKNFRDKMDAVCRIAKIEKP